MELNRLFDSILIQPFMEIYDYIFQIPSQMPLGARIIIFALVINFLLMPLYRNMEAIEQRYKHLRKEMSVDISRIKKYFKGRERYFYIRATQRQYEYRPWHNLLASVSLFLQIFIFFSILFFLKSRVEFDGVSFGVIEDLGRPDSLLWGINFLPIFMFAINVISICYYSNDLRARVNMLMLGVAFLFILYSSSSGLVLYWVINNFWSMCRNMLYSKYKRE
jgi:membrane protein insertase Oxa1/YidC/SpoIIIJ